MGQKQGQGQVQLVEVLRSDTLVNLAHDHGGFYVRSDFNTRCVSDSSPISYNPQGLKTLTSTVLSPTRSRAAKQMLSLEINLAADGGLLFG